jgi:hypothetical protein
MSKDRRASANDLFEKAARALTTADFDETMRALQSEFPDVSTYVLQHPPSTWALSHMPHCSHGIVTSNNSGSDPDVRQ